MTNDKTHLTFGGSNAHRWLLCPGSAALCATLPPQIENEHMAAGTRAHALLELAVRERRASVLDFDGQALQAGWPEFSAEDVEAVQIALDHVNGILDREPAALLFVERQVVLSPDVGGTADVMIYAPSTQTLHVIDYKHGVKFVEAEGNPQLKLYAAAALLSFTDAVVTGVHGTIIQPRVYYGQAVRTAVYSPADLIGYADEVETAVDLARSPSPPYVAGETQCHWCPATAVCPALRDKATELVTLPPEASARVPVGDEIKIILPPPGTLRDPLVLAEAAKAALLMETWAEGVLEAAKAYALSGAHLPGFKVVEKRATRKWSDAAAAEKWFSEATMLDQDEYAPRKLLSVAKAEALVKSNMGAPGVKLLAAHVVKESSGLKVVPETAAGEPVNVAQLTASGFAGAVTIEAEQKG